MTPCSALDLFKNEGKEVGIDRVVLSVHKSTDNILDPLICSPLTRHTGIAVLDCPVKDCWVCMKATALDFS